MAVALMAIITILIAWGLIESSVVHPVQLVELIASIVFLIYLPKGHPLARQWAMYVAGLALLAVGGVGLVFLAVGEEAGPTGQLAALLTSGFGALVLWSLFGKGPKEFFGLHCRCGSYRVRAASLLFNKMRCGKCHREWRRGDLQVDLEVFE